VAWRPISRTLKVKASHFYAMSFNVLSRELDLLHGESRQNKTRD
jgi:hypothetical protein